jgi:malonyl-CoA O-methyltransferase
MQPPAERRTAEDVDTRAMARAFDRASAGYDVSAVLQAEVRSELLDRLEVRSAPPARVLDLGCGTGHAARALKRRHPRSMVIALDIAAGMVSMARRQSGWFRRFERVCAAAERLPLAAGSIDLVYSNLMLQWCPDLDAVFGEIRRVLAPGGLLVFSTFGPDTLRELRAAWAAADGAPHVNRFIDLHDVGAAVMRAGLAEPVLDVQHYTLTYPDVRALMRDLKAIGAHNVAHGRARGLTGRGRLAAMEAAYETFRRDGRLPATYEVVFGTAWGAAPRGAPPAAPAGETRVPLSAIGRRGRDA